MKKSRDEEERQMRKLGAAMDAAGSILLEVPPVVLPQLPLPEGIVY